MSKDMSDMLQNDVNKIKRARQMDVSGQSLPTILEYAFWGIALLFVIGMLASMPFVGPDKAISGIVWLTVSTGGMAAFSLLALAVRYVPDP